MSKSKAFGMAVDGAYGAASYDRTDHHARALTRAVELYMPDAAYFTRDDLLHLPTFSSVATITAYGYVCEAVKYSIERGWMVPVSRTELVLSGKKRAYNSAATSVQQYLSSIHRLLPDVGEQFSFDDVLNAWDRDTHLSMSAKRTFIRQAFKQWIKDGTLLRPEVDVFVRKS